MTSKTIIVGAGQAGAVAAVKLREFGYDGEIVLIGAEDHPPYERPELSKGYALGAVSFEKLVLLSPSKADELGIDLRLSTRVVSIDRANRRVTTGQGTLDYDTLVLATGGSGRRFPLPDCFTSKVHVVRSREDADTLGTALANAQTAAIIGGGWLGLEAAATCRKSGLDVHVFEAAPRLCARVAPEWLSDVLKNLHVANGVTLHLGQAPEIMDEGQIKGQSVTVYPDVVILAIGMTANDSVAEQAGLACEDGILVSAQGQTSDPNIFAIGDCARYRHLGNLRRESWQNANQSAEDLARVVTCQSDRRPEPDWFWSNQFDQNIQILGTCTDDHETVLRPNTEPSSKSLFFLKNGTITGCISINAPRDIGMSRSLVSKGQKMDSVKLADPSVPLRACRL